MSRLEHVNITVSDTHKTAQMLNAIFGWHVRWEGASIDNGYSMHVGEEDAYLALYAGPNEQKVTEDDASYGTRGGLNHLGVVVDDLDAVEERVKAYGFEPHFHADYEPGRRFYFYDHDRIEIEVVEYG